MSPRVAALGVDDLLWALSRAKELVDEDAHASDAHLAAAFDDVLSRTAARFRAVLPSASSDSLAMAVHFLALIDQSRTRRGAAESALQRAAGPLLAETLQLLRERAPELLSLQEPTALAGLMRAMRMHRIHDKALQSAVAEAAAKDDLLRRLDGDLLAEVLCYFAAALDGSPHVLQRQLRSSALWSKAADAVEARAAGMSASCLSDLALWLQAVDVSTPQVRRAIATAASKCIDSASAAEVATLVVGLTSPGPSQISAAAVDEFMSRACEQLARYDVDDLLAVAERCSLADLRGGPFVRALCERAATAEGYRGDQAALLLDYLRQLSVLHEDEEIALATQAKSR